MITDYQSSNSSAAPDISKLEMVSGSNDITRQAKLAVVPLAIVMDKIKAGKYQEKVARIRDLYARGEVEAANKLKKTLSYFVYGIVNGSRKAENVVQANGIILDFDHVGEIEAFKRKAAENIPGAKYVFRSPNDGVKVLIPFSVPIADPLAYRKIWEFVAEEAENQMGIKPDPTHDMCRACFVSWDKELIKTQNEALDVEFWLSALQNTQTESTPPTTGLANSDLPKEAEFAVTGCSAASAEQISAAPLAGKPVPTWSISKTMKRERRKFSLARLPLNKEGLNQGKALLALRAVSLLLVLRMVSMAFFRL